MRILHILNDVQQAGNGIINVAIDLACSQARDGHEVRVASAGGGYEALLTRYGVGHFDLDQTRRPTNLVRACSRYRTIVRKFRPDIVHAHMITGAVISKSMRGRTGYGLVTTAHNVFHQRGAALMRLGDRVITVSEAASWQARRLGVPGSKIRVVRNGTLYSPRSRPISCYQPAALQGQAVVTVAGMYRHKGIAELIAAFEGVASRLPETHLYLVGDGPDRPEFEDLVLGSAVASRVHFEGFQEEPQRYMLGADVFVLASHSETFGLVLTEAREAGCAVVANAVGGIPEALEGGNAGVLVPPGDVPALEAALMRILSDPREKAQWQRRARQKLEAHSVDRVARETEAVYRELLRHRR